MWVGLTHLQYLVYDVIMRPHHAKQHWMIELRITMDTGHCVTMDKGQSVTMDTHTVMDTVVTKIGIRYDYSPPVRAVWVGGPWVAWGGNDTWVVTMETGVSDV